MWLYASNVHPLLQEYSSLGLGFFTVIFNPQLQHLTSPYPKK